MLAPVTSLVRDFTADDQERFAALTGDRNPMHMDAIAARRTQAGAPVVHGMHVVLWALDQLAARGLTGDGIASIRVGFSRFVLVGQTVELRVPGDGSPGLKNEVLVDGAPVLTITLKAGARAALAPQVQVTERCSVPVNPTVFDEMRADDVGGWLLPPIPADAFRTDFPHACEAFGADCVCALALQSTLVGMVCPGLHSIFSGFSLRFADSEAGPAGFSFRLRKFDPRFRLATLDITGAGLTGSVEAFLRFPPIDSSMDAIRQVVIDGEFDGRHALVIGGSRGLGATTAKLIAAGGGRVTLTYVRGVSDAKAIQAEIENLCGPNRCAIVPFAAGDKLSPLIPLLGEITHLYYFATPPIFRKTANVFQEPVFDEFLSVYVRAFVQLLDELVAQSSHDVSILYPSSVAVVDRPKNMTEYAMAKAAGEILCADFARAHPRLHVTVSRLPRVLTDQTATVPPVEAADAVATMLPLLRSEFAATKPHETGGADDA